MKFLVHSLCCPLSRLCICKLARYSQGKFVLVTGKVREFYIVRPVGTMKKVVPVSVKIVRDAVCRCRVRCECVDRTFIGAVDPHYVEHLPSSETLSDTLFPAFRERLRSEIETQLSQSTTFAVTAELWTNDRCVLLRRREEKKWAETARYSTVLLVSQKDEKTFT